MPRDLRYGFGDVVGRARTEHFEGGGSVIAALLTGISAQKPKMTKVRGWFFNWNCIPFSQKKIDDRPHTRSPRHLGHWPIVMK